MTGAASTDRSCNDGLQFTVRADVALVERAVSVSATNTDKANSLTACGATAAGHSTRSATGGGPERWADHLGSVDLARVA
jgi:hypothetical protein